MLAMCSRIRDGINILNIFDSSVRRFIVTFEFDLKFGGFVRLFGAYFILFILQLV